MDKDRYSPELDDIFSELGIRRDEDTVPSKDEPSCNEAYAPLSDDMATSDSAFEPSVITDESSKEQRDADDYDRWTDDVAVASVPAPLPAFSLKECRKTAHTFLERCGLPDMLLLRVIAMYLMLFAGNIRELKATQDIDPILKWQDFVENISLGSLFFSLLLGTAALTLVHYLLPKYCRMTDPLVAIGAVIYFDCVLLWKRGDVYLSIGVMIVSLIIIGYAIGKLRSHRLLNRLHWSVCGVGVLLITALSTAFIIVVSIYRHRIFGSMTHDFGLFVQMFHSLAEDLTAVTTMERDTLLSHFEVHASYIYYVLVPFFKLFPTEETLLVAQALLAMGGVVPLFLIARRHDFKGLSLIFVGAMYVFCTALIAPCFYDFHENAFLPTLLMWTLWAADGKKALPFYLFAVLTCIVKEDAPLYVICIGLYWFFEHKGGFKRLHGLVAAAGAAIYMMRITAWLTAHGDGTMMTSSRFGHLLIDPEGGLVEVVINSLSNPGYFFSLLVKESTFVFFVQIMLPLLFMPLFTKKIHRFLLILPFVITNLVVGAKYGYAANIEFQYIFGPATMLLFLTLINVSDLAPRTKQTLPVLLGTAALVISMGTMSHHLNKVTSYHEKEAYFQALEATLDSLPTDAVIAGDPFLLPHIADRDEVYIYDFADVNRNTNTLLEPDKYDFIVLKKDADICLFAEPLLGEAGYVKLKTDVSEHITIFMSPHYRLQSE